MLLTTKGGLNWCIQYFVIGPELFLNTVQHHETLYNIMSNPNNGFCRHTSALRPKLTENNKLEHVLYAIGKMYGECYGSMEEEVHVDQK